eukprot:COSAG02_NODE_5104_length_4627_cov_3.621466_2_plen_42_part_00
MHKSSHVPGYLLYDACRGGTELEKVRIILNHMVSTIVVGMG